MRPAPPRDCRPEPSGGWEGLAAQDIRLPLHCSYTLLPLRQFLCEEGTILRHSHKDNLLMMAAASSLRDEPVERINWESEMLIEGCFHKGGTDQFLISSAGPNHTQALPEPPGNREPASVHRSPRNSERTCRPRWRNSMPSIGLGASEQMSQWN